MRANGHKGHQTLVGPYTLGALVRAAVRRSKRNLLRCILAQIDEITRHALVRVGKYHSLIRLDIRCSKGLASSVH